MKVKVWDLPLRLFHWLLVASVATAFVSAKIGGNAMVWHGRAGLAVVGLVAFRIVWGFVGSTHSRFSSFVSGPKAIKAYLDGQRDGVVGHNPLGALSVLGLMALVGAQAISGLFANDDISYQGYLYALVGANLSGYFTEIHEVFEPLLILLVAVHLGAIGFYAKVKKDNLTIPMITGWKDVAQPVANPRGGGFVAFLVAAAVGIAAAYVASGAMLPPPQSPAAVETPSF